MNQNRFLLLLLLLFSSTMSFTPCVRAQNGIVVFQTDFGLKDGAVSAMKGVAMGVSGDLKLFDLTHEIPAYNIWEAAYRLEQTAVYWPKGTVFVSVVDPGVGTERKSVVLKTKSGHFFVTPDNGTLTLVAESLGIDEVREIDEATNRRKNSEKSYTFHGRDVYAYTAARLAAKKITFADIGKKLPAKVVAIDYQKPTFDKGVATGSIPILDVQYGNIWTNIDADTFKKLKIAFDEQVNVTIKQGDKIVFSGQMPYSRTFGAVPEGSNLCYLNSLMCFSIAINMGNFSEKNQVFSGPEWTITLKKIAND